MQKGQIMRHRLFPIIAALALALIPAAAALAQATGDITVDSGGQTFTFAVDPATAGIGSWWIGSADGQHAEVAAATLHADGTELRLFLALADGQISAAQVVWNVPQGQQWLGVDDTGLQLVIDSYSHQIDGARIAGRFSGPLRAEDGSVAQVAGRFDLSLPLRAFDPIPDP